MRGCVIVATMLVGAAAMARTWTSASGQTVEAEYVGMQGALVILKTEAGQKVMIPLTSLSADDQQYVKEQQAAKMPPPPTPPGRHGREPHVSRPASVPSSTPAVLTGSGGRKEKDAKVTVLSAEEIAALKKELVVDEKAGEKLEFAGGIVAKHHLGDNEPDWKEGQPIPVTITCELVRAKLKKDGLMDRKPLGGGADFYVLDESGTVVIRGSETLDRLKPETNSGFRGEVPKPGKYTLVIYCDYKGTRFGLSETLTVRPPVRR